MVKHIDEVTRDVIGVAMRLHSALGPGLFETVYEEVLLGKLGDLGYAIDRQKTVEIEFEGKRYSNAFKIDLLVDERLILEIKSVDRYTPLHAKQLLTYLRLMRLPVGLVLNFGCLSMREGIKRVVNNHVDSALTAPSA